MQCSDNCIPSRLDFVKERFGGPLTTDQVENVKTFLGILIVLFAVGPVCTIRSRSTESAIHLKLLPYTVGIIHIC